MSCSGLLVTLAVVVGGLGLLIWRARRELTLFVLAMEKGEVVRLKGRIPRRLLVDIADAVRQERLTHVRIYCRIEDGAARLRIYGDTNPGFEQVLRNLIGEYPLTRLKQAPKAAA